MSSWRTMVMKNAAGGDLDLTLRSAPYADMASPLARWHRVSSALKQMPELRRYLQLLTRACVHRKLPNFPKRQNNSSTPGPMLDVGRAPRPAGCWRQSRPDVEFEWKARVLMFVQPGLSLSDRKEKCSAIYNVFSRTTSAVERAHAAELNVGCSGGSLRRKLDGLPVRTSSVY